jgi:thiol-disulfide isomerase/thioredoxin
MTYQRKDLLADLGLVLGLGVIALATLHVLRPSLARIATALFHAAPENPPLPAGAAMNYDWEVTALDGKTVPLSTLQGKVIFLNFWASWCGPCKMELPSIQKLHDRFKGRDIVFLLVSDESPATLQSFVAKEGLQVPVYTVRRYPQAFYVTSVPTSFIVSRSGKIAFSVAGAYSWGNSRTAQRVEILLKEARKTGEPR